MPRSDSCTLCGKPVDPAHHPFCSRGCKDRDLLNWLGEGYRFPGTALDPDDAANSQSGLDRSDEHD